MSAAGAELGLQGQACLLLALPRALHTSHYLLTQSDPCLPPAACTTTQAVGSLRPEVAAELGLPPDVVVAPGGGDNAMAALGAGAVREGTWVLSLGTSGGLPAACAVVDVALAGGRVGGSVDACKRLARQACFCCANVGRTL